MAEFLLCVAVFSIALLVWFTMAQEIRDSFHQQFPPISDAEFLALCKPGTSPEVALKVRRIVAEYFDVEYERVHPSTNFVDLGVY
jgi:hypothetical protein